MKVILEDLIRSYRPCDVSSIAIIDDTLREPYTYLASFHQFDPLIIDIATQDLITDDFRGILRIYIQDKRITHRFNGGFHPWLKNVGEYCKVLNGQAVIFHDINECEICLKALENLHEYRSIS